MLEECRCRNKRTLKKRIRRTLSLTAFITVFILSSFVIYICVATTRFFISTQAENVSYAIQEDINSGRALNKLGIDSIKDIDKDNHKTEVWIDELSKSSIIGSLIPGTGEYKSISVIIEVNQEVLYSNYNVEDNDYFKFLRKTESIKPIYDEYNNEIGHIIAKINPNLVSEVLAFILIIIVVFNIAALIIAKILSMFLVMPVINPVIKLDKIVRALADGDLETAGNTEINIRKPLKEIERLIDSTNTITRKMSANNDRLKNQFEELEMQNEELIESKMQIQMHQGKLIQSEKMASVGMLTAAITHEINTPIGAINSNAQIEKMVLDDLCDGISDKSMEDIEMALAQLKEVNETSLLACSRIVEIIRSLKSFSRLDQAEFQEANINEGIKSVLLLTNNLLKRRITVHEDYEDIPLVKCFPGQLNQVFMNIIVNASQAIEGEGEIFIHTYQKDRDIYISIRDTGVGIKEEHMPRIFDPSFTTKGVGIGLGLGLYISYNIIQNHNGEIIINSEPGHGAEFIIRIPIDNDRT